MALLPGIVYWFEDENVLATNSVVPAVVPTQVFAATLSIRQNLSVQPVIGEPPVLVGGVQLKLTFAVVGSYV